MPPAFDSFVDPARARPQIWRLLVGLVVTAAVYAAVTMTVVFGSLPFRGIDLSATGQPDVDAEIGRAVGEVVLGTTPDAMILLLLTFLGMALGPVVAVSLLHRRRPGTLFGPARRLTRHFVLAALVAAAFVAVSALVGTSLPVEENLALATWLRYLPVAIVGLLIQTGAEEVLFRGYLQQQLAARFRSPLVWMGLPTILFAALHYAPAEQGDNALIYVLATGVFGLAAADLTARTGSLGAAWGFHFANNFAALLIIGLGGPLSGLALYTIPLGPEDSDVLRPYLFLDIGLTVAIWATIRVVLSRGRLSVA